MVERRLKILAPDRLSADRVNGLRADNPERGLMLDLAAGMRVFLPEGITPNESEERSKLRKSYVSVAPAGGVSQTAVGLHATPGHGVATH